MRSLFSLGRLATAASVAALTMGFAFIAQPAQKASAQLVGSGATSIQPLVDPFFTSRGHTYNAIGSGAGRTQFQNGETDFVSTDLVLPSVPEQVVINPVNISVGFGYNVPEFTANLTSDQICGIIDGSITTWDQVGGPEGLPITFVYRSDSSGTTSILSTFTQRACGFPVPDFPVGVGAEGSSGVVSTVRSITGAIGYVDDSVALAEGLPVATLDTTIEGPNYVVFRNTYSDRAIAVAARDQCLFLTGSEAGAIAVGLGYVVPAQDPSVCDAIVVEEPPVDEEPPVEEQPPVEE